MSEMRAERGIAEGSGAVRPRRVIADLPAYIAGKPASSASGLPPFKLSSNENPGGPVPAALAAVQQAQQLHRYPSASADTLRAALAEHLGIDSADIVTGTGSLGALSQILQAFAGTAEDGVVDEVIYPWRSFEAYPIVVTSAGARNVQVPNLVSGAHDLAGILAAITANTRVIMLCTPNNPTGPALRHSQVEQFLAQVPAEIVVVLDQAYLEYASGADTVNGLALYRSHPNVVLLRTFSKAHGLAGLRVGYSIAQQSITEHLRKTAVPFAVSSVAEAAATASLDHAEEVWEAAAALAAERDQLIGHIRQLGWDVPDSEGNFLWLNLGEKAAAFGELAHDHALAVRVFPGEGVRVSIGEQAANERFLTLCKTSSLYPGH